MIIAEVKKPGSCGLCGSPITNRYGFCQRTDECRREYRRRYRGTKTPARDLVRCPVCGRGTWSKFGVCRARDGCKEEYDRRYAEALGREWTGRKSQASQGHRRDVALPSLDVPEEWRPVVGFEGLYEVSDQGRVKSLPRPGRQAPEYVLTPKSGSRGSRGGECYYRVALRDANGKPHTRAVHRIVAEAFLGLKPEGQLIRHGLGGPYDNRVVNLCYGTYVQNAADRKLHRQLMREDSAEELAEADVLAVYRACVADALPALVAGEFIAALRHASALLRRPRPRATSE
jgi:NUMOD4 motif/HNH endonuclease